MYQASVTVIDGHRLLSSTRQVTSSDSIPAIRVVGVVGWSEASFSIRSPQRMGNYGRGLALLLALDVAVTAAAAVVAVATSYAARTDDRK